MRNLTELKKEKLATEFFEYIQDYQKKNNGKYPKYDSQDKYYKDVYINLLICQQGLCAYTEQFIYREFDEFKSEKYWKKGKYAGEKPKLDADIEHFKPQSTCNLECDWQWNNLFLVLTHINRNIKKTKIIPDFLKPDNPEYSPEKYFTYNLTTHRFVASQKLDEKTKLEIEQALEDLGINSSHTIISNRKNQINKYIQTIKYMGEIDSSEVKEFKTAFHLIKEELKNPNLLENLTKITPNTTGFYQKKP